MKLSIEYTEADFREANAQAIVRQKMKLDFLDAALMGLIGAVFAAILIATNLINKTTRLSREEPRDLVLLIGPSLLCSLLFGLMFIGALTSQLRRARMRASFASPAASAGPGRITRIIIMVVVFELAGIFLGIDLIPTMEWTTTRRAAFLAGLVPFLVMLMAMFLMMLIFQKKMIAASWRQQAGLHRPRTLEFTDEQVTSMDGLITVNWKWDAFVRFRETRNLFLVVTEDSRFLIVPKRILIDPAMMMEFRALLQTHIAEGHFLTLPVAAFPVVNAVTLPPPVIEALPRRTGM